MKKSGCFFLSNSYCAILFIILYFLPLFVAAQGIEQDSTKLNSLDEVFVKAVKANAKMPFTYSNVTKEQLASRNLGQDIPILLNYLPSVVTTSDAGNGVGYTGIRVRGSDASRVNITINGVPYNDSESQGTFWVNMPDFASSVENIQLVRGVGTSTNGSGAFGASLHLMTDNFAKKSNAEIANSFGSFNTRKHTVKFSTGLLKDHFELAGRLSNIDTQGYVDRAASDLKSYFLQGTYAGKSSLLKLLVFGGKEKTYQSWYGVDAETLKNDRTYNFAGQFTDEFGNTRFYENQTDNYQQDHYQLHWNEIITSNWSTNLAFHYTKGKGYFEEYQENQLFTDYNLLPVGTSETTDLITQKWLDNDFYGTTFSLNYKDKQWDVIFGGAWNKYIGNHFGTIIWARQASQSESGNRFYDNTAYKTDGNLFTKINYQITSKINLFADIQFRRVSYKAAAVQPQFVDDVFQFLNPKGGISYDLNQKNSLYFSYAKANREPNRTDYENGNPKPEQLDDFELGLRHESTKLKCNANLYYMGYKDQLILTGELDEVGNPIRSNADQTYRAGIELDAIYAFSNKFSLQANFNASQNRIEGNNSFKGNQIAFSPAYIASAIVNYKPIENLTLTWMQKYVGEQYLSNAESVDAKLDDYYINDFNISYTYKPKKAFSSIVFSGLINNFLNKKYSSNGADYGGGFVYYYPQAGTNFLVGLTLKWD